MSIENLIKNVPPPADPFEALDGPWEVLQVELGTALPSDYKAFVRLYGGGYFMEFLGVSVPRASNPNVRFESQARLASDVFRNYKPFGSDEVSYPVWPQAGGLLAFGGTDNGDYLFWLTEGSPDTWKVVVWGRGAQQFERLDCDMTDFLAGLASGEIMPEDFPEDLLPCELLFQPNSRLPVPVGNSN